MSDQASTTETKTEPAGAPAAQATTTTDDAAAIRAELERTRAELAKVRQEAAAHRVEKRTAAEKAAEDAGEHKKHAELLKARLAELEPLEGAAKRWAEHEARETARIARVRESLEPHWQVALDAAPTLDGKLAVLTAIDAAKGSAKPPPSKPPVTGGAPGAPPTSTDWNAVIGDPVALREAKARDPAGWAAHRATLVGGSKPVTHFERFAAAARERAAKKA